MVSGISSAPTLAAIPMMVARAPPNRRAIGPAAKAPSTPPTPPMVKRRPITPAEAWTWRTRKTISTAAAMPLNRLAVAVVAAIARRSALPKTKRRPSAMPCTSLGWPPAGDAGLRLGRADGADGDGGDDEARRVDRHRGGAADGLHETTRDARPGHRRHLRAAGELRVALHQVLPPDQGRAGTTGRRRRRTR